MSQSEEPNPYAPSQVASQVEPPAEPDPFAVAELNGLVERLQSLRYLMAVIFAVVSVGLWMSAVPESPFRAGLLASMLATIAVGYWRGWLGGIFFGAVAAAGLTIGILVTSTIAWYSSGRFEDFGLAIAISLPFSPVCYFAVRTLQLALRIRKAGLPINVDSSEVFDAPSATRDTRSLPALDRERSSVEPAEQGS